MVLPIPSRRVDGLLVLPVHIHVYGLVRAAFLAAIEAARDRGRDLGAQE
jgi:hypothetical protein